MKVNPEYKIEKITDKIFICLVKINQISDIFLPKSCEDNQAKRMKSVYTGYTASLSEYFTKEEINKINGFKIYKKQAEWIAGRYAVKKLVNKYNNIEPDKIIVDAEKGGAPYIRGKKNEIPISISHSSNYAAAGICTIPDTVIGLDVELIEEGRMEKIKKVAFTENEILSIKDSDKNKALYLNWTKKEAYLKFIKKGFSESLKNVEIINNSIFHNKKKIENLNFFSKIINDEYAFSLLY